MWMQTWRNCRGSVASAWARRQVQANLPPSGGQHVFAHRNRPFLDRRDQFTSRSVHVCIGIGSHRTWTLCRWTWFEMCYACMQCVLDAVPSHLHPPWWQDLIRVVFGPHLRSPLATFLTGHSDPKVSVRVSPRTRFCKGWVRSHNLKNFRCL